MTKSANPTQDAGGNEVGAKRETGQATLSAIRDVSIAATDALGKVAPPRRMRWLVLFGFLLLVYVASSLAAIYSLKSPPLTQVFVAPLVPVLIAAGAFWRCQVWKFRSHDWRFGEKVRTDALNSLAHETGNAVNAMYANLAAFRESNPQPSAAPHLEQIDEALARIDAALEKAITTIEPSKAQEAAGKREESKAA
jgi:hypothetical protein